MKRQPILTADEVLQIVEEELQKKDPQLANRLKARVAPPKPVLFYRSACIHYSEILHSEILREKGIYVYRDRLHGNKGEYFIFIAGECGRVIEEMANLEEYLVDLEWFVSLNEEWLPSEVTAEKKKLETYSWRICSEIIIPLEEAYTEGNKRAIRALLRKAENLKKEIEGYLNSIMYLQKIYEKSEIKI